MGTSPLQRIPLEIMRRRKGFTAQRLAKEAHTSVATIRNIELGKTKTMPRYETMNAIAQVLGCEPTEIEWPNNPYAL